MRNIDWLIDLIVVGMIFGGLFFIITYNHNKPATAYPPPIVVKYKYVLVDSTANHKTYIRVIIDESTPDTLIIKEGGELIYRTTGDSLYEWGIK